MGQPTVLVITCQVTADNSYNTQIAQGWATVNTVSSQQAPDFLLFFRRKVWWFTMIRSETSKWEKAQEYFDEWHLAFPISKCSDELWNSRFNCVAEKLHVTFFGILDKNMAGGVEGWGENADNCNWITIKILKNIWLEKNNFKGHKFISWINILPF